MNERSRIEHGGNSRIRVAFVLLCSVCVLGWGCGAPRQTDAFANRLAADLSLPDSSVPPSVPSNPPPPTGPPPTNVFSLPPVPTAPTPGTLISRRGDEIVIAGQFVHTGTPVVLWMDPGGYDAYRVERRFVPLEESSWEKSRTDVPELTSPNRYGLRASVLTREQTEHVRGGGWDLPLLQSVVDQFVIHFDTSGTSRECFKALHDRRGLSIHFMLDLDGTLYQTLDLKEQAWHATRSNGRSIGIEISNVGAAENGARNRIDEWYVKDTDGRTHIAVPVRLGETGIRTPNFVGRPARAELLRGSIQGKELVQYDFTSEQYDALIKLTAALCKMFPKIKCDYPRDDSGKLVPHKLSDDILQRYQGLIGHYHIQADKIDPGPAFQWEYVVTSARKFLEER